MELFIQIVNGQPYQHPIEGNNFREGFPHVDTNNLPPEFARFKRVSEPRVGVFEVVEGVEYKWVNGIVTDVWNVRPMTSPERILKTQQLTEEINAYVQQLKNTSANLLLKITVPETLQALRDYITALDAWVLTNIEDPKIPEPPKIKRDGTLQNLNIPGSAPDVLS